MSDEEVQPIPELKLTQLSWVLSQPSLSSSHDQTLSELVKGITKDAMGPFLDSLLSGTGSCTLSGSQTVDGKSLAELNKELKDKNEQDLKSLEDKIVDAKENLGETEYSGALKAKAIYLAQIGEKEKALEAYRLTYEKTAGLASKIDLQLSIIRVAFFHSDARLAASEIAKCKELAETGGDWDRRNRLKVYEGLHLLSIRNFKMGGKLLLDTLSTFTATECISFIDFVALCIIAGVLTLDRPDLKKKIIESPEVLQSLPELPHLKDFTTSLYNCEYAKFFHSLAEVEEHHLATTHILAQHTRYYVREMRIKAYAQLLESYRSVTMASLSSAFGVSEAWLDADLAKFIAQGRLNFTIDRVNGIVETSRPDLKNARYEAVIKSSDALLNSIQRLSRVVG